MVRVRKGNDIQTINDDKTQSYVSRGYDVISAGGAVLQKAVPTDLSELQRTYEDYYALKADYERLQKAYTDLQQANESLESENADLFKELESLQKLKTTKKAKTES